MKRMGRPVETSARNEQGQVSIVVVLLLALFLIGFFGFAVDVARMWFHRQAAQGAADAACQAGAMNLLLYNDGSPTPSMNFTPGTAFNCTAGSSASPCRYAALNGYDGTGLSPNAGSNAVQVTFPGSVPGVTTPDSGMAPVPFMRVDIIDRVRVYLTPLITGNPTQDVRAFAVCGTVMAQSPIPIIVLHPTCQHSFEISGSANLKIIGGPTKSVQVNSTGGTLNCAAATTSSGSGCTGGATIDLTEGGPQFTGSDFGTFGGPLSAPSGFSGGSTGSWVAPATPIPDPYQNKPAPPLQSNAPSPTWVDYLQFGCPDHSGCRRYQPGRYYSPIVVKNETAIFDPGIYYMAPTSNYDRDNCGTPGSGCVSRPTGQCYYSLVVDSNGVVRPSTASGGDEGTLFYLSGPRGGHWGSVFLGSNAGKSGGRTIDSYLPAGNATSRRVVCPAATSLPDPRSINLSNPLVGNVFLAPCTGVYGSPDGSSRGIVFFQDRANNDLNGQPSMQGGGGLLIAGSMYFHNCPNSPNCQQPPTDYNAFLQLQGNPGSETRVLGNIITDELVLGGNASIYMALDPNAIIPTLKVTLLR